MKKVYICATTVTTVCGAALLSVGSSAYASQARGGCSSRTVVCHHGSDRNHTRNLSESDNQHRADIRLHNGNNNVAASRPGRGTRGERGPQGPQGPAGTAGAFRQTLASNTEPCAPGATCTVTAQCPAGTVVSGGGFRVDRPGGSEDPFLVIASQFGPIDSVVMASTTWEVTVENNGVVVMRVNAFAVCPIGTGVA